MAIKYTEDSCKEKLKGKPLKLISYGGSASVKSLFECSVCSYSWSIPASSIFQGHGCRQCAINEMKKVRSSSEEDARLCLVGREILMVYYAGSASNRKSKFECIKCQHIWTTNVCNIKQGQGCPKCSKRLTPSKDECELLLSDREVQLLEYAGTKQGPSKFKCTICHYTWKTDFGSVERGSGCAKCSGVKKLTEDDINERLTTKNIKLLFYGGSVKHKSKFECKVCESIWETHFDTINNGSGCPKCAKSGFKINKPTQLYVLLINSPQGLCYGFGITNSINYRMKVHRRNLKDLLVKELEFRYFDSGHEAAAKEKIWKNSPYIINIGVSGFMTECVLVNEETTNMIFN